VACGFLKNRSAKESPDTGVELTIANCKFSQVARPESRPFSSKVSLIFDGIESKDDEMPLNVDDI